MRCKACDAMLTNDELKCHDEHDADYCTECKIKSEEEFDITDMEFIHGSLTGVQTDGSSLIVDTAYLDYQDDRELHF